MRISDWSSDVCSSDLIGKVLPARRWRGRVRRKSARFPFPSGIRPLRLLNFIGSHSGEVIISLVEFTPMVKAEPAPCAWPIGRTPYTFRRCAEFPVFFEIGRASCRERVCQYV